MRCRRVVKCQRDIPTVALLSLIHSILHSDNRAFKVPSSPQAAQICKARARLPQAICSCFRLGEKYNGPSIARRNGRVCVHSKLFDSNMLLKNEHNFRLFVNFARRGMPNCLREITDFEGLEGTGRVPQQCQWPPADRGYLCFGDLDRNTGADEAYAMSPAELRL